MQDEVGRYKLLKRLAAGGMGEVYLAAQHGPGGFEKVVALKRMLPTVSSERELVKAFIDEARLVARLAHRNIAQIFDLGEGEDGYFVAMEFVQGPSVRALCDRLWPKKTWLPAALSVDIAAQVADALAYAWQAPGKDGQPLHIVHRDVTPQNILVSIAGDVKLIDFGVAKSNDQSHATETGVVKGKLAYMSPEQSSGKALDGRSDQFSLGIVLYELLTGENPFRRNDVVQTVLAIQNEPFKAPSAHHPNLAPTDAVLARMLAKNPEERFGDMNECVEALMTARAQLPRPPQRLGPFVAEHFGEEISGLVNSLNDSAVRRAMGATEKSPPPDMGMTVPDQRAHDSLADASTRIGAPVAAAAPSSSGRGLVVGGVGIAAAIIGGLAWFAVGQKPAVEAPPPAPLKAVAAVEPPKPPPVVTPPRVEPVVEPAPPVEPPQPEPVVAKEPEPVKPPEPVAKHAAPVRPPKHVAAPPTPPPPTNPEPVPAVAVAPRTSARVQIVGPFGSRKVALTGEAGRASLAQAGELAIALEYAVGSGAVTGKLVTEPWSIVAIDGVSRGKTPLQLPPLTSQPLSIELRRPGGDPVQFVISGEVLP